MFHDDESKRRDKLDKQMLLLKREYCKEYKTCCNCPSAMLFSYKPNKCSFDLIHDHKEIADEYRKHIIADFGENK